MTKPKTKKSRCPCCGGTGKVEKKLLQTYTWKDMGKRSKAKKRSFISVLTWRKGAPNGAHEPPMTARKDSRKHA